jgi:hypothetical protein
VTAVSTLCDLLFVLNQFIKICFVKPTGCYHRLSTSLLVTQINSSWFTTLKLFGLAVYSAYVNTFSTINNLHSAVNFNWRDSFSSQKFSYKMLLKVYWWVLSAGFHFMHNSNTTFNTATYCQLSWNNRRYRKCPNL